jgi:hypothetical protein
MLTKWISLPGLCLGVELTSVSMVGETEIEVGEVATERLGIAFIDKELFVVIV